MTLLLEDTDIQKLDLMGAAIPAMEEAFREFQAGIAVNRPRLRYDCASSAPTGRYFANALAGAVPKYGMAALRVDSGLRQPRTDGGAGRVGMAQPGARNWGLVLLFSLETAALLAIMHDFTLSGVRVGATTAAAMKYLARHDSRRLGIIGTGKQARSHLLALSMVKKLERVLVYSPNPQHRDEFCKEMVHQTHLWIEGKDDPRLVVEGSDIVVCATNGYSPVFRGKWLVKGQTVATIANSDVLGRRDEADEDTLVRADLIVINDKESVGSNNQRELLDPLEKGLIDWNKIRQLGEIVSGKTHGRTSPEQLIYYKNNTGMAIQFAAIGALAYRQAKENGLGRELPSEWFGTDLLDWYRKGFFPSP